MPAVVVCKVRPVREPVSPVQGGGCAPRTMLPRGGGNINRNLRGAEWMEQQQWETSAAE